MKTKRLKYFFALLNATCFYMIAFFLVLSSPNAHAQDHNPPLFQGSEADFADLQNHPQHSTLQIEVPNNSLARGSAFDGWQRFFSCLFHALASSHPEFKANALTRGPHVTVAYLGGLTINQLVQLIEEWTRVSGTDLREAGLLPTEPIPFVTMGSLTIQNIISMGKHNRAIALRPHPQFARWVAKLTLFLARRSPLVRHSLSEHWGEALPTEAQLAQRVHVTVLQYGGDAGPHLTPNQEVALRQTVLSLLRQTMRTPRPLKTLYFDTQDFGLDISQAPRALSERSPVAASFRLNAAGMTVAPVARLIRATTSGDPQSVNTADLFDISSTLTSSTPRPPRHNVVEFSTQAFLDARNAGASREDALRTARDQANGGLAAHPTLTAWSASRGYAPLTDADFFQGPLGEEVRQQRDFGRLPPSSNFARIPNPRPVVGMPQAVYVRQNAHPSLAPSQAVDALGWLERLGFLTATNPGTHVGGVVYASSVRGPSVDDPTGRSEGGHPSDIDTMITQRFTVPDAVATLSQARRHAAEQFIEQTLKPLMRTISEGRAALLELRLGSRASLRRPISANTPNALRQAYYDNCDLTLEDLVRGYHVDPQTGRRYSIIELLMTADFIKLKLDVFKLDGSREELSIQYLLGFLWHRQTYSLITEGFKGLPAYLLTGVYSSLEAAHLALLFRNATIVNLNLRSPGLIASATQDLVDVMVRKQNTTENAPHALSFNLRPKGLKKILALLTYLAQEGLGQDTLMWSQLEIILQRLGVTTVDATRFRRTLLEAINDRRHIEVNALKRLVNDFREFCERDQHMFNASVNARLAEYRTSHQAIRTILAEARASGHPLLNEAQEQTLRNLDAIITPEIQTRLTHPDPAHRAQLAAQLKAAEKVLETMADAISRTHLGEVAPMVEHFLKYLGPVQLALSAHRRFAPPAFWRPYIEALFPNDDVRTDAQIRALIESLRTINWATMPLESLRNWANFQRQRHKLVRPAKKNHQRNPHTFT